MLKRVMVLIIPLVLLVAACGDDDAATTTAAPDNSAPTAVITISGFDFGDPIRVTVGQKSRSAMKMQRRIPGRRPTEGSTLAPSQPVPRSPIRSPHQGCIRSCVRSTPR